MPRKNAPLSIENMELPHQRTMLRLVTGAGLPACLIYTFINLATGAYFLASLEAIYAALTAGVLININKIHNIRRWAGIVVAPMLVVVGYGVNAPNTNATMFVWVFAVPGVCYLSLGAKRGFIYTGALVTYLAVTYILKIQDHPELSHGVALFDVLIVTLVIWAFSHIYEKKRSSSYLELENLATRDPLTGLYNRRRMASLFEEEVLNSSRGGDELGLVMIDLDHFKAINDTYGHDAGDDVLRTVSALLERNVRATDYVFRMGGEEFCVMLRNVDVKLVAQIADTLRSKIETLEVASGDHVLKVTASLGCTVVSASEFTLDHVMQHADKLLYVAKEGGRNRVEAGGMEPLPVTA